MLSLIMDRILQPLIEINQIVYGIKFLAQSTKLMAIGGKNGHFCHFIITGQTNTDHWQLLKHQEGIGHGFNFHWAH